MQKLSSILREHRKPLLVLLLTWGIFFSVLFGRMISLKSDGLYVGHQNVWSDWALHGAMANSFAFKPPNQWFDNHPLYAGGKFTYPWLTNFISGMLMRVGFSLPLSFIIPSIIFSLMLIGGMYALFFQTLRSKAKAVLAITFYFLSSGLGFWNFLKEFVADPSLSAITYPIRDFGRFDQFDWYAGNVTLGLLLPQRAFLLGVTIGVWVIAILFWILENKNLPEPKKHKLLLAIGLAAGIMPIAHAHSFIALIIITGLMSIVNYRRWRLLLWYVIPATLLSGLLYYIFVAGGIERESFIRLLPGWTAPGGLFSWIHMWLLLWGTMLPAAIAGFFLMRRSMSKNVQTFFIASFAIFALGNLVLFQPVQWDNTKLFWWAYLGFSGLAAYITAWLWKNSRIIAIILVVTLTATGILESIRIQRISKHSFQVTNTDDIDLGLAIRAQTDPSAVFLTAPKHNHFVMMWGIRPILMGYTGWVWNYGFKYEQRERDLATIYRGAPEALSLLQKYKISYIVIGPPEINDLKADENYFQARFPLAFKNNSNRIYDTRQLFPNR